MMQNIQGSDHYDADRQELDRKVKTALNETRLLILGVQVLLGFQFQSFFQDGFSNLSLTSQWLCVAGLMLLIASTGLLITPSMEHRLVESGASSERLLKSASFSTGWALAPLMVSLGLAGYVVIERHFGASVGTAFGLTLAALATFAWFGFEIFVKRPANTTRYDPSDPPLATRIEQLLMEARIIIPGAQALFGFQFLAMLTTGFDRLPETAKIVHAVALGLVAVNIILLMTPAALHRLSFNGENSESFLRMGSVLVIAAPFFLAAGISAETYVVLQKVTNNDLSALTGATVSLAALIGAWYGIPVMLRYQLKT